MSEEKTREKKHRELLNKIENKEFITVLHSGDMGDIVASLPAAKELYEETGKKVRYLLDITGGLGINDPVTDSIIEKSTNNHGMKFNRKSFDFLKPLLDYQPYIAEVAVYDHNKDKDSIDLNFNFFRVITASKKLNELLYGNLMYSHQIAASLVFGYKGKFLEVPHELEIPVSFYPDRHGIVGRSLRYHSSQVFLQTFIPKFLNDFKFVGTDLEYEAFLDCLSLEKFRNAFPHAKVNNALEMADLVNRSLVTVVNPTLLFWIAVGLEKPIIHELNSSYYVQNTITPDYRFLHYVRNDKYLVYNEETAMIDKELDLKELFKILVGKKEKPEEKKAE